MTLPENLKLFFDGGCWINPGGTATYGWHLNSTDGTVLVKKNGVVCKGPKATCNVAEWSSLTYALRFLKESSWNGNLTIIGDSQLVIHQLNNVWQCRKDTLKPFLKECKEILKDMNWTAKWVKREQNSTADALAEEVYKWDEN